MPDWTLHHPPGSSTVSPRRAMATRALAAKITGDSDPQQIVPPIHATLMVLSVNGDGTVNCASGWTPGSLTDAAASQLAQVAGPVTPAVSPFPSAGHAAYFPGSATLTLPSGSAAAQGAITGSAFTVELSCSFDAINTSYEQWVIGRWNNGGGQADEWNIVLAANTNTLTASFKNAAGSQVNVFGGIAMGVGATENIAVSWDGTTARLFVNGVLDASAALANALAPTVQPTILGQGFPLAPSAPMFRGFIDNLRFSTTARYTATYTNPTVPPSRDANTASLWTFDLPNLIPNVPVLGSYSPEVGAPVQAVLLGTQWFVLGRAANQALYAAASPGVPANIYDGWVTMGSGFLADSSPNAATLLNNVYGASSTPMAPTASKSGFGQCAQAFHFGDGLIGPAGTANAQGAITGAFTAECIASLGTVNAAADQLIMGRWATNEWQLRQAHGNAFLTLDWVDSAGANHTVVGTTTLSPNTFYQIAATWDLSNIRIFVNGHLDTTLALTTHKAVVSQGLQVGLNLTPGSCVDEIRISNSARYTATYTPATAPFTSDANTGCLYHFEPVGGAGGAGVSVFGLAPPLVNAWTSVGGVNAPVRFRKDHAGWVHLQGKLATGTAATVAFTLPAGCRPGFQLDETTNGGTVTIAANGQVTISAVNTKLDGIHFFADQ